MTKLRTLGMALIIANAMQIFATEEEMQAFSANEIAGIQRSFAVMQNVIDYLQPRAEIPGGVSQIEVATNTSHEQLGVQMRSMQKVIQELLGGIRESIDVNAIPAINNQLLLSLAAPFRAQLVPDPLLPEGIIGGSEASDGTFIAYLNGSYDNYPKMRSENLAQKLLATEHAQNNGGDSVELSIVISIRGIIQSVGFCC